MILIYKNKCDTIWILIFIKITYFIMIINKKKEYLFTFSTKSPEVKQTYIISANICNRVNAKIVDSIKVFKTNIISIRSIKQSFELNFIYALPSISRSIESQVLP